MRTKSYEEMRAHAIAKVRDYLAVDAEFRVWHEEKRALFWRNQGCWFGIVVGMMG